MHKKTSGQENNVKSQWHKDRETYNTAFEITAAYVEDKIINQKQVLLLTTLTRYYQAVLQDLSGHEFGDVDFLFYFIFIFIYSANKRYNSQ